MDVKEQALLSAAVALTLISEKARFQAARTTDTEAKLSLLETGGHCKTALRMIQEARHPQVVQCEEVQRGKNMTTHKRDVILSTDFLPKTWRGLERFVEDTIDPIAEEILHGPIESWAYLWFRLRKAEDRAEWFPSGKWATVQHIEQMLNESVTP